MFKRHRPGQMKSTDNEEEKRKNRKQALRQSKSRNMRQLKKIAKSLQKQDVEPVEALFIIKETSRNIFKYFGFGNIVRKFENGEPLSDDKPKVSKISKTFDHEEVQFLTPGKYNFSFMKQRAQKSASATQAEELDHIPIFPEDSHRLQHAKLE
jgi:hypothetical protein